MKNNKNLLEIEWSTDKCNCETCGTTWSTGAVVKYNGEIILNEPANASCFESVDIDEDNVLRALCNELNIDVVIKGLDD